MKKGFTLIELLIVIVIIGVLAGTLVAIINPKRMQDAARDAALIASMQKIILNIEGYYSAYGKFPSTPSTCTCADTSSCQFLQGLTPGLVECFSTQNTGGHTKLWFKVVALKTGEDAQGGYDVDDYDVFRYHDYNNACLSVMSTGRRPMIYAWQYGGKIMLCDPGTQMDPGLHVCETIYPDPAKCKPLY